MASMLKFTCQQCGGRIAIQPKHIGRLVTCPDCGATTHPLAGDLEAARAGPTNKPTAATSADPFSHHCDNCGASIGRLEPRRVWENNVVCGNCFERLSGARSPAASVQRHAGVEIIDVPARGDADRVAVRRVLPSDAD